MTMDADEYWGRKLSAARRGFRLFPRGVRGDGEGASSVEVEVPAAARAAMNESGADSHVRSLLYLSAFTLLLCRYTNDEEVLIAEPGPLFLRCEAKAEWTIEQLLRAVGAEFAEARRHGGYSLGDLTAPVRLDGEESRQLFAVGYVYGAADADAAFPHDPKLLLSIEAAGGVERVRLRYDAAQYPAGLMQRFAEHYSSVLGLLLGPGEGALSDIDFVTEVERETTLNLFNRTEAVYPNGATLHGLFEEQAARRPEATAVVHEGMSLTYRELNEKANRLARWLRESAGVRAGDCVGLLVGRSEKMVVAQLGVMKAGAAYVPINPRHPWETVSYMLENTGVRVLLVNSDTIAAAANFGGGLFILDVELDGLTNSAENPGPEVGERELAYVIYTSGSTGRPKGVAVEHTAVVNTIFWRNDYYEIDDGDTNLQLPSYAFDSSVLDIFCFLAAGAVLVIPDEERRLEPAYVRHLTQTHGVTRLLATSSYYKLLNREIGGLGALRSVTVAGEATTPELVAEHQRHLPGVRLVNEYGPTENAVCSSACDLAGGEPSAPIGRPVSNVKVFVLDGRMRPVPVGVGGEMYLGGAGLARGYVNQPALTAERFVPDPFSGEPGARLYRTGDWACWRPDGVLEFQGRMDGQVKVRGFRIELSEVEAAVRRHAGVRDAAVLCKQDWSGNNYLAAYAAGGESLAASALTLFLRDTLPYYEVPDVVKVLPALPLNLNGKVDTARLRALDDFRHEEAEEAHERPGTATEKALLGLCSDLYRQPALTPDDNFFSIGANSLRVMEMVNLIRRELGVNIDFSDVYEHPTVRELAARIGGAAD
ncbi:MAG: non-ribosomal peptide synthetase [Pyrinomonadaceae bacterium]